MRLVLINYQTMMNRVLDFWKREATLASVRAHAAQAATRTHRFVRGFEPWGIILTFLSLAVALVTVMIDLEDRQSERTFRAWQVVRAFQGQAMYESPEMLRDDFIRFPPSFSTDACTRVGSAGSPLRQAVEYLNRQHDGFMCHFLVGLVSGQLTGNFTRQCLFPQKNKEYFLVGTNLASANLAGANLEEIDLTAVDLTCADLRGADLTAADLTAADLVAADLAGAILLRADLTGADLTDANLTRADLTNADLTVATLTGLT